MQYLSAGAAGSFTAPLSGRPIAESAAIPLRVQRVGGCRGALASGHRHNKPEIRNLNRPLRVAAAKLEESEWLVTGHGLSRAEQWRKTLGFSRRETGA